jgi:hypothetical protein
VLGNTVLELGVSWQGIATSWRVSNVWQFHDWKIKSESTVCPVFPDFRKGVAIFEGSYDSSAFHSHKSSVKMTVGMQYWWNDTDRWKTKVLGEKLVAVLLRAQNNSQMLARFLTFDMRRRLLKTLPCHAIWRRNIKFLPHRRHSSLSWLVNAV